MEPDIAEAASSRQDGAWSARARQEASSAVAALFAEHHLALVRLAVVMVGDVATAEDVVQDAFENLQARWDGLRDKGSALAYARAAVMNGGRNSLRRSAIARKHAERVRVPGDGQPDSAQELADNAELMAAIRDLPGRQREVLVLRYYLDLDVAEVAGDHAASLAALPIRPIPASENVTGIALTPDGTQLAIAVQFIRPFRYRGTGPRAAIEVVRLATGAVRTWTTRRDSFAGEGGEAGEPSWADDGRLLAFLWNAHEGVPDRGVYVLNTTAPGSNLMAARWVIRGAKADLDIDASITSAGRTIIAAVKYPDRAEGASMEDGYPAIAEFSARTGHLIRTLSGPPHAATPRGYVIVSVDPSGQHLLVTTPSSFGRLDKGKFTRLPMPPDEDAIAAW